MSGTNYITDREQSPEWVCFENGRTVGIAYPKDSRPYLVIDFEKEGERWLRAAAAAEDDAGSVNIGSAEDVLASIIPAIDSVPVEGVVLPERPKLFADGGPHETWRAGQVEAHFTLLETKLLEAITQRDAARADPDMTQVSFGKILLEANQWKERAEKSEAALAAMTEDRNLWQNAHDEDCPNKAALATERKDKAQLQYALEQSESKFPAERARALNWLYRMVGEIYGSKRTKQRIQKAILAAQK